jgi:coenzyme F420-0:L-glutamate ligase/coenzyme F420-1:gamma-L-glutamate ligase
MTASITYTALPDIPLVQPGDDLHAIIKAGLAAAHIDLRSGDILVIAQKIISKAENRYVKLAGIRPSAEALRLAAATSKDPRYVEVILSETSEVLRHRQNVLIVVHRLGFVMANAGIDESNIAHAEGEERVLLLPKNPDQSCSYIKTRFDDEIKGSIGVIINDSFGRPWRNGVTGVALGAAGVPALADMRGTPDLFGRTMRVTEIAIADELAAAASLIMGQGAEGLPVVHVRGFSSSAPARNAAALIRPKALDLFR